MFERMFRAHHLAVYRYVARRVEAAAVQDVVAETFLTAWRRFDELVGEPLPWLLGIARRVSANHLRGRARRMALRDKLAAEPQVDTHSEATVDDALLSALMALRDCEREVLLLVAWDGLTNREAAIVVGCSASAFAVRLYRARRRLAQVLSSQPPDGSIPAGDREGVVVHDVT